MVFPKSLDESESPQVSNTILNTDGLGLFSDFQLFQTFHQAFGGGHSKCTN